VDADGSPSPVADGSLCGFEYQGEGSERAATICGHCGLHKGAHPHMRCEKGFEARGPLDFDTYYCGCRGWD
jgi:hypothetical protein